MLPLQVLPNRDRLMNRAAALLAEALNAGLAARGAACAALSGGLTPAPAYEQLAATPLDWPRVTFALVDDRFVPPTHEASNEGMLRRALAPALAKGAKLIPMWSGAASAGEAARHADSAYAALDFDVALMGMGADGHTASWFPGADGLDDALDPNGTRTVVATHATGAAGSPDRLTLTLPAIARAEHAILLITGADKHATLLAAIGQPPEAAPVAGLLRACAGKIDVLWTP